MVVVLLASVLQLLAIITAQALALELRLASSGLERSPPRHPKLYMCRSLGGDALSTAGWNG